MPHYSNCVKCVTITWSIYCIQLRTHSWGGQNNFCIHYKEVWCIWNIFFFFGFLSELSITCFLICCKEALFAWTFTTLAHCDLIINGFSCYCYAIFQFHGVFEIGYVPFNICRRWFRALAMVILSGNLTTCLPVCKIFSRQLLFPSLHLSYHCTSIGFCRIC